MIVQELKLFIMSNRLLLVLLLASTSCIGQMKIPFTIGSIGNINTSSTQMCYTFVDNGKCLVLQNGLGVLKDRPQNTGKFTPVCPELTSVFRSCPLTAYPNPTKDFVTVRTAGCFDSYYFLKGTLQVVTELGQVILSKNVVIADLRAGVRIDLRNYASAAYFVKVEFQQEVKTLKIVKIYE